ncbi:MAG: helix-turn-helix transcriptional regulator [Treponema sp.]|nr:helix-turn-helix transcriptional regulator [Treponema sp.]
MSDFWKRVDEEIEYKGINRASLARKCNFSVTNIGQGIKSGSTPSADTAVKIASVLGVTVEYLVTGSNSPSNQNKAQESEQLRLYRKHSEIIKKCEQLSPEKEQLLANFIENFGF